MPEITQKALEQTVKHYIKSGDYFGAKNYVENFADNFKTFDKEKALEEIREAENKQIKKPKNEIKEE